MPRRRTEQVAEKVAKRLGVLGDGTILNGLLAFLMELLGNCGQPKPEIHESIKNPTPWNESRAVVFARRHLPFGQKRRAREYVEAMKTEVEGLEDAAIDVIVEECQAEDTW